MAKAKFVKIEVEENVPNLTGYLVVGSIKTATSHQLVLERPETHTMRKPRTKPNSKPAAKQDAQAAVV